MIAHLRGTLLAKHPNQAVVETGGIGYDVTITVPTFSDLPSLGSNVALHIHTHVREDVIALYGFLRPEEKQLFEKLITVSGIGDKLPPAGADAVTAIPSLTAAEEDVLSALQNLGYQRASAEKAVMAVSKNGKGRAFEVMFREALALLSK